MPDKAVNISSAKRKLELEDDLSVQGNSFDGKRFRENGNDPQASQNRDERSWIQKFEIVDLEEVQVQTSLKDKSKRASQAAINKAKPSGRSNLRRSKRFESSLPDKSLNSIRRWSEDQEICLLNAILDTLTPQGEFNRAAFYERAKEQLRIEVSNSTLYEKMRSIKKRFFSKEGKLKKQTAHEHTLFLLCEKLWGTVEAANLIELEKPNPEEKKLETSSLSVMEAENSYLLKPELLNRNSGETSSYSREETLNPDSAKNLKNRKNGAVNTIFANLMESEKPNPDEKEIENSSLNVIEAENSNLLKSELLSRNSAENSSNSTEEILNPDSAKNLKSRENGAVNTNFGEVSESRENSAINVVNIETKFDSAVNLESRFNSTENLDSEVNVNSARNPKHMNKTQQSLSEETHRENTDPNLTVSPEDMGNIAKGSLREETQGENTHLLEVPIHQETQVENATVNGIFVDKSPHQEIHGKNAGKTGHASDGFELPQTQFRGLESRIEELIENSIKGIETRLEAAIQNSVKSVVTTAATANSHSLEGFCGDVRKSNDALSNVARTLKDLMHGVNSVEEFPSLGIGKTCQMQQQWRKIKIQQLKTFSEGLELLANQCKLLMRTIET